MNSTGGLLAPRWTRRFTLLGSSAAVQGIIQLISGVAGLLLVRTLGKPQYAWFTIAMTMSSALTMLSDGGIGTAVTSLGGGVWQDRRRFSGLIQSALRLRWILTVVAVIITAPWTLWLLARNGARLPQALLLTVLTVAPAWALGTTAIFNVVNRLHSRLASLQITELAGALTKLVLIAVPVLLALINVTWALAAVAASYFIQSHVVRRQVLPLISPEPEASEAAAFLPQIRRVVRHMYPNNLFMCVQGQLATWLISVFGSSSRVADLGALSRLGILFSILGAPIVQLIAPAFARCADMRRLRRLFLGGVLGYAACVLSIVLLSAWRGDLLLRILGEKYAGLSAELVLVLTGFAISGITGFFWTLNLAKGWVGHVWWNIPLSLGAQALGLCLVDVSSVKGAAWLGIIASSATLGHGLVVCVLGFRKHRG